MEKEKIDSDNNQKGCLNMALGAIESVFTDRKTKTEDKIFHNLQGMGNAEIKGIETEVDRAFLDSDIVAATIDCTDGLEKKKLIKEFDKLTNYNISRIRTQKNHKKAKETAHLIHNLIHKK